MALEPTKETGTTNSNRRAPRAVIKGSAKKLRRFNGRNQAAVVLTEMRGDRAYESNAPGMWDADPSWDWFREFELSRTT